jgi:N-methylhydantoinase A/oxoprolinase/acetone carboxylase beta subunit
LRARALRRAPALTFAEIAAQEFARHGDGSPERTRELYFGPVAGLSRTPVVSRASLLTGPRSGPLVIEEPEATILVPPDFDATLDSTGSIILTRLEPAPEHG